MPSSVEHVVVPLLQPAAAVRCSVHIAAFVPPAIQGLVVPRHYAAVPADCIASGSRRAAAHSVPPDFACSLRFGAWPKPFVFHVASGSWPSLNSIPGVLELGLLPIPEALSLLLSQLFNSFLFLSIP